MKNIFTREVKIGLMIVIGLGSLFFGVNYLKGINVFVPSNSYYVKYHQVGSLEKSAPVRIKGYKVGLVRDIITNFEEEPSFTVVLSLDDNIKIPVGSTADLYDDGLMGTKSIQLLLAKNESPSYYKPGETIPATVASSLFDKVQESVLPQIQNMIPQIDSLMMAIRLLAENKSIQNTLASLEVSTKNLEQTSADLKKMMHTDIPPIVANLNTTMTNFAATSANINKVDFAQTISRIDSAMNNVKSITQKINENQGTLGLLVNDKTLYQNLSNTTNNSNLLMIDLKENPSRYIHFSVFGKSNKK